MEPSVFVVILNWNNWKDTIKCIDSVYCAGTALSNITIVICDNGSTDGSLENIKHWADDLWGNQSINTIERVHGRITRPLPYVEISSDDSENSCICNMYDCNTLLVLIRSKINLGYAAGNNVGIRFALRNNAEYVFILNNDTIIDRKCILSFIDFSIGHPDAALMAPRIFEPRGPGSSFSECDPLAWAARPTFAKMIWPSQLKSVFSSFWPVRAPPMAGSRPLKIYYAPGSAMMFRTSTIEKVGLFDENTFLYYEEFIMAEKLLRENLSTYYVENAIVWHLKGATTSNMVEANKYITSLISEKYYLTKYLGITCFQRILLLFVRLSAYVKRMLTEATYRKEFISFIKRYCIEQ
jgi:GT2 family glycosyltransferase